MSNLTQLLVKLLSLPNEESICVNAAYRKYKCVTVNNILYNSKSKKKSSIAFANWDEELFGPLPTPLTSTSIVNPEDKTLRPVRIEHLVMISLNLNNCIKTLCLAVVSWFQSHPCQFEIGKPAQVWCKQLFECHGMS